MINVLIDEFTPCLKDAKIGKVIAMLHQYQFAVDEINARQIMEVYDYVWTDEEI